MLQRLHLFQERSAQFTDALKNAAHALAAAVERHGLLVLLCSTRSQVVRQSSYIELLASGIFQRGAAQLVGELDAKVERKALARLGRRRERQDHARAAVASHVNSIVGGAVVHHHHLGEFPLRGTKVLPHFHQGGG